MSQTKQTATATIAFRRSTLVELRRLAARKTLWSGRTATVSSVVRDLVERELAKPQVAYAGV